jgi:hypothetical protein
MAPPRRRHAAAHKGAADPSAHRSGWKSLDLSGYGFCLLFACLTQRVRKNLSHVRDPTYAKIKVIKKKSHSDTDIVGNPMTMHWDLESNKWAFMPSRRRTSVGKSGAPVASPAGDTLE